MVLRKQSLNFCQWTTPVNLREHTFADEEGFQQLNGVRRCDLVDEVVLLHLFFRRVAFCDVHVALVVVVELAQRHVDRPLPKASVL